MPPNSDTFAFPKAQPAVKTTACQCGAAIEFTTCPKRYCVKCSGDRKRASARVAMEKQRRKHGVAQVKGTLTTCARIGCGREFERDGIKARYCEECTKPADQDRSREYQRALRRTDGSEPIGTVKTCANADCSKEFAKARKGRQIYCQDCMELRELNKLPHMRATYCKWRRKQYATDPAFAVNELMRKGIWDSLARGAKAGRSWESLVGYTLDDLVRHLERQFTRAMSWANRGSYWELEHIRPIASFEITGPECQAFRDCWGLHNLRPFPKVENRAKRAQRLFLL